LTFVSDSTKKLEALTAPNSTAVAPVNFVPATVTVLPPLTLYLPGFTPVIVGSGSGVKVSPGTVVQLS
jgi:hypothetical protein